MAQKLKQDKSIGHNIQKLRQKEGLTQEEVVAHLQLQGLTVSRSVYSQMEGGAYNIRISELVALKNLFHADFADFFIGL